MSPGAVGVDAAGDVVDECTDSGEGTRGSSEMAEGGEDASEKVDEGDDAKAALAAAEAAGGAVRDRLSAGESSGVSSLRRLPSCCLAKPLIWPRC